MKKNKGPVKLYRVKVEPGINKGPDTKILRNSSAFARYLLHNNYVNTVSADVFSHTYVKI